MDSALLLSKYSIGVGDRFAHQGKPQLRACMMAAEKGVEVIPVWNKSNREHTITGSTAAATRAAADEAVKALGWNKPYYVDADHINIKTVDNFISASDFYTIDVADLIGQPCDAAAVQAFAKRHPELQGELRSQVSINLFASTMISSSKLPASIWPPFRRRAGSIVTLKRRKARVDS